MALAFEDENPEGFDLAADLEPEAPEVQEQDPAASPVGPEHIAAVTNGSLAARMQALGERMSEERWRDFPIPLPDEVAEVLEGAQIVVRARVIRDRARTRTRRPEEVFIIKATRALLLVEEDGSEFELPGWSTRTAAMLGKRFDRATDLVAFLFDNGNRPLLNEFMLSLYEWMARGEGDEAGAVAELEDELGK